MRFGRALWVAALCAALHGCAYLGVVGDGGSVSWGRANDGILLDGVRMPDKGPGFWAPPTWRQRGRRFGTRELVEAIGDVAAKVASEHAGARLSVADIAQRGGGKMSHHSSHQTGRDVDLLFYVTDLRGKPVDNTAMVRFTEEGKSVAGAPLRFDVPRNWALVRAFITSPVVIVQRIFVAEPLAQLLLDYARSRDESSYLLDLARDVMLQPGSSAPHDDHFHVRIACDDGDAIYGCEEFGRPGKRKPVPQWTPRIDAVTPLPNPLPLLLDGPQPT